jgi:hypothetical protein
MSMITMSPGEKSRDFGALFIGLAMGLKARSRRLRRLRYSFDFASLFSE